MGMTHQDTPTPEGASGKARTSTNPIGLILADDRAVVRSGLRMLLDSESDFEVVAEASNIEDTRRYVRGHHPRCSCSTSTFPVASSGSRPAPSSSATRWSEA
jgi:hypothetical protein